MLLKWGRHHFFSTLISHFCFFFFNFIFSLTTFPFYSPTMKSAPCLLQDKCVSLREQTGQQRNQKPKITKQLGPQNSFSYWFAVLGIKKEQREKVKPGQKVEQASWGGSRMRARNVFKWKSNEGYFLSRHEGGPTFCFSMSFNCLAQSFLSCSLGFILHPSWKGRGQYYFHLQREFPARNTWTSAKHMLIHVQYYTIPGNVILHRKFFGKKNVSPVFFIFFPLFVPLRLWQQKRLRWDTMTPPEGPRTNRKYFAAVAPHSNRLMVSIPEISNHVSGKHFHIF